MCGRFVSTTPPERLALHFGAAQSERSVAPSYNITPGREIWTVVDRDRRLTTMRWGLVPHWSKDPAIGNRLINARSETIDTKNSFRDAFRGRRCLIPADGFYEWQVLDGHRHKQPWYFHAPDDAVLAFAGLWETWSDPANPDAPMTTCTIITCDANSDVSPVHDRMPVLMQRDAWDLWLDSDFEDRAALKRLMHPAPDGALLAHMVGTEVNRPGNDGPVLIEAIDADPPGSAQRLFESDDFGSDLFDRPAQ